MNESNNEQEFTSMAHKRRVERLKNETIQVNDKVQWIGFKGDEKILLAGVVESVGEFNGKKTFTVTKFGTFPEDRTRTMISANRCTKIQKETMSRDRVLLYPSVYSRHVNRQKRPRPESRKPFGSNDLRRL